MSDFQIGPNRCHQCGGEYGNHKKNCPRVASKAVSGGSELDALSERIIAALTRTFWNAVCDELQIPLDSSIGDMQDAIRKLKAGAASHNGQGWVSQLKKLRDEGWMVAVHNDYRQDGKHHTFWLFTRVGREGQFVKGEGETDADALQQITRQLASHALPAPPSEAEGPQKECGATSIIRYSMYTCRLPKNHTEPHHGSGIAGFEDWPSGQGATEEK